MVARSYTAARSGILALCLSASILGCTGGAAFPQTCTPHWAQGLFPSDQLNGHVYAIAAYDDGTGPALYVGGGFTLAGGVRANGIARWKNGTWSALGTGMDSSYPYVYALAVYDDGKETAHGRRWVRA